MATIINNLPKGNVKAPQGAIMKINTGEQLTEKDFNNNTEFVLEFTPDNLDPNGNPIYVRNGITEDEVIIGNSQVGIKIPYSDTANAIDSQTYLCTVNDDKDFYSFFTTTIRDSISILDENGKSYRWYDDENSKGLRLTSLSDDDYRGNGVAPGEIFYLKRNLSFGGLDSFEFVSDFIYLSATESDVKFTTLLINNHNSSITALKFTSGQIKILNKINSVYDFEYTLNQPLQLTNISNNPTGSLMFINNMFTFYMSGGLTSSASNNVWEISNDFYQYLYTNFILQDITFHAVNLSCELFIEPTKIKILLNDGFEQIHSQSSILFIPVQT